MESKTVTETMIVCYTTIEKNNNKKTTYIHSNTDTEMSSSSGEKERKNAETRVRDVEMHFGADVLLESFGEGDVDAKDEIVGIDGAAMTGTQKSAATTHHRARQATSAGCARRRRRRKRCRGRVRR